MLEVSLEGVEFYSYHGFYKEEQKVGNKFSLDIKVTTAFDNYSDMDDIDNTVNYEDLYTIAKLEMQKPSHLLENIANNIIKEILLRYPTVESAEVSVSKFNPPIGGICSKAKVTIRK